MTTAHPSIAVVWFDQVASRLGTEVLAALTQRFGENRIHRAGSGRASHPSLFPGGPDYLEMARELVHDGVPILYVRIITSNVVQELKRSGCSRSRLEQMINEYKAIFRGFEAHYKLLLVTVGEFDYGDKRCFDALRGALRATSDGFLHFLDIKPEIKATSTQVNKIVEKAAQVFQSMAPRVWSQEAQGGSSSEIPSGETPTTPGGEPLEIGEREWLRQPERGGPVIDAKGDSGTTTKALIALGVVVLIGALLLKERS